MIKFDVFRRDEFIDEIERFANELYKAKDEESFKEIFTKTIGYAWTNGYDEGKKCEKIISI